MVNNLLTSVDSTKNRFADFFALGLFFVAAPKGFVHPTAKAIKPVNCTSDSDPRARGFKIDLLVLSVSILDQQCAPQYLNLGNSRDIQQCKR